MNATEIVYKNDAVFHINPVFEAKPLVPGDVLEVWRSFYTLGGHTFEKGDRIELIARTFERPFGFLCTLGNWIVRSKRLQAELFEPVSIWSSIDRAYSQENFYIKV